MTQITKKEFISKLKAEFAENNTPLTKKDVEFAEYGFEMGVLACKE